MFFCQIILIWNEKRQIRVFYLVHQTKYEYTDVVPVLNYGLNQAPEKVKFLENAIESDKLKKFGKREYLYTYIGTWVYRTRVDTIYYFYHNFRWVCFRVQN